MKKFLIVVLFFLPLLLWSAEFDGQWLVKFEMTDQWEEGVLFEDVTIEKQKMYVDEKEYEFKVIDDFYILFSGEKYYYGKRDNMVVLYGKKNFKFNRILLLKPYK